MDQQFLKSLHFYIAEVLIFSCQRSRVDLKASIGVLVVFVLVVLVLEPLPLLSE